MEPIQKSLKDMQSIDVRTVDAGTLRDIQNVSVNRDFPKEERIQSYLQQIGNPYCFRYSVFQTAEKPWRTASWHISAQNADGKST